MGYSRSKRAGEPSENRWSPSPMNARNTRGIISAFPALWAGIGYLTVRNRVGRRGEGEWDIRTFTRWTVSSGKSYFTFVFCEDIVFLVRAGPFL
ncbi:hypothetical protein EVAR_354_1 [Eumeta japonica]|uniref:Uncharacterized protein n=1 Tax=Eumeta variegata TaxID=151549 RepID=A0A4C1SCY6_EUMVA|nr:hypothetical protein EVAR_354_1 [Eumeta japonica]